MLACPFCGAHLVSRHVGSQTIRHPAAVPDFSGLRPRDDEQLQTKTFDGWACRCGEMIPYGMEKDDQDNCASCTVEPRE
jgi:hypothetical protein